LKVITRIGSNALCALVELGTVIARIDNNEAVAIALTASMNFLYIGPAQTGSVTTWSGGEKTNF
jgi:hypothetical protein